MTKLEERLLNIKSDILEDGIHLDVEIYKQDEDDEFLSVYIGHDGGSGAEYHDIKNEEDVSKAVFDYVEKYI